MVRWQDIGTFFKKKSRSRTIWISSGSSIFAIFAAILMLTGTTITSNGDIVCGDTCDIYVNITSTYWRVCFSDDSFEPLYFNQTPISYEVFVPARGKGNWRPLKAGDCIERKNKYNVLPNRFKIEVEKKPWETLKYGVDFGSVDLDPFLFSENIKFKEDVKYEKVCTEVFEDIKQEESYECEKTRQIPVYVEVTDYRLTLWNESVKEKPIVINETNYVSTPYTYDKLDSYKEEKYKDTCTRTIIVKESVDCIPTGEIKIDDVKFKADKFFCGFDECDEFRDSHGGMGDSNHDGICQEGETCISIS